MVEVSVGGCCKLEGSEADVIKGFVINANNLISVLNELMNGQCGVVWFNDGVGHLRGWNNGESAHDSVGVLLSDLGNQKGSHAGTSTTSKRVGDLEALKAISTFSLLSADVED